MKKYRQKDISWEDALHWCTKKAVKVALIHNMSPNKDPSLVVLFVHHVLLVQNKALSCMISSIVNAMFSQ